MILAIKRGSIGPRDLTLKLALPIVLLEDY
jgi:hypothetical protein